LCVLGCFPLLAAGAWQKLASPRSPPPHPLSAMTTPYFLTRFSTRIRVDLKYIL